MCWPVSKLNRLFEWLGTIFKRKDSAQPMLSTTTFSLSGYRVVEEKGVVRGLIVRSLSIVGSVGAGWQSLFGGQVGLYTKLCEQARRDAFELMVQHAEEVGANAIVGIRYDATEIQSGVAEVLCYGTAVLVEKSVPA